MGETAARRPNANLVLAMLLVVYTFNFLDRQILGILAKPIMTDLGLTKTQFGAVGGLAFAILYSVLGVPLALLADRTSRSAVVAGSLVVWSGFTALCGVAGGFAQLFLFRLGVGVGEAGGAAPSIALIADYFPPERRARAIAIFYLGVPLGLAGGTMLGAFIAALFDWRAAFLFMGIAGIVIAPVFMLIVRDLPRERSAVDQAPLTAVFPLLARKASFWLAALGASFSSLCGYGLALWTPSILIGNGLSQTQVGLFLGSMIAIGGVAGVYAGGWLADRLGKSDRAWYARIPAIAWLISAPTFAAGFLLPPGALAWLVLLIPNALNIVWLGPLTTAIQHLVPPHMRATASGSFLLINNLIGLGAGPLLIGALSDALKADYGADALRYAAVSVLGFYLLAALLMVFAQAALRRDWID